MREFLVGIVLGLLLGSATVVGAQAVVGDNGYLLGWDVTYDGNRVCSDPYIWTSVREIECD